MKLDISIPEERKKYLKNLLEQYHKEIFTGKTRLEKILVRVVKEQKELGRELKVFDLGCGAGYISRAIACLEHQVVGIDQNLSIIGYAQSTTPEELPLRYYSISAEAVKDNFLSKALRF